MIDIGDTNQDDILKVINTTIIEYIDTLSIDSSYELELDVVSDENGILTVNILVISSDEIPINQKEIIDESESRLNGQFGEGAVSIRDDIETTMAASNILADDDTNAIAITIGCLCGIFVAVLIFYGLFRYRKKQALSVMVMEAKQIELAIDAPGVEDGAPNGTTDKGTNGNGFDGGEGAPSNMTGHRSTQSEQLYELNTVSTPSGVISEDNEEDNNVTPGMHTNGLDIAENDGETVYNDEKSSDNDNIYDKNNRITKGDSDTNSNDEIYGKSGKQTRGRILSNEDTDDSDTGSFDAIYDSANNTKEYLE